MKVQDILDDNLNVNCVECHEDDSVFYVLRQMATSNVGAVIVRDKQNDVVGIFSERDYARKLVLEEKTSKFTKVKDVMVPRVIYVSPDFTLEECLSVMTELRIRNLPVIENKTLIAVLPMEDIVKKLISEKEFIINELTHYIKGTTLEEKEFGTKSIRFYEKRRSGYRELTAL